MFTLDNIIGIRVSFVKKTDFVNLVFQKLV